MKKIFAILLVFILAFGMLAGCNADVPQTEKHDNVQKDTQPNDEQLNNETTSPKSEEPDDGENINYNFEYFQATNSAYGEDSLIDGFPLLNAEDEFWDQIDFTVFPQENCELEVLAESPTDMNWNEFKDITIDNVNMLVLGGDENAMPSLNVNFINEDLSKTWLEVVRDRDWYGNCYLDEEKHLDLIFPIKAASIAEMIVANYGQPSEVDEFNGVYEVTYNVINRSVTMKIGENTSPQDCELPYQIQLFIRIYEE